METTSLDCGHAPSPHGEHTTGYGETPEGERICWDCCAVRDRAELERTGRGVLYLTLDPEPVRVSPWGSRSAGWVYGKHTLTNWPGSLEIPVRAVKRGRHNIAGFRWDCWFTLAGREWHGVQIGRSSQLCRVRRLRAGEPT